MIIVFICLNVLPIATTQLGCTNWYEPPHDINVNNCLNGYQYRAYVL